jgi:hypothetical protein
VRGFAGATGMYNFVAVPQRGLTTSDSGQMVGWNSSKSAFEPIGKIGGALK